MDPGVHLMSTFGRVFSSSVGTKLLIGLTGLALFAYLILHLAGNALIFAGPETFNEYSHTLISNPLILPIEIGLAAIFLLHVYKAIVNMTGNRAARPLRYEKTQYAGHTSRKSVASSTMIWSGLVVLLFVIVHVKQFKFGTFYETAGARGFATSRGPSSRSSASPCGSRSTSSARWSSACTCVTASRAGSSRSASIIRSTRAG